MKKEFCMMAIGLLLAGCSADEEIANVQTSEANAISFNVVGNNPQTKATIISSHTFAEHTFEVFAFRNSDYYMGTAEGGVTIKYYSDKVKWDYKDLTKIYYWPHTDALDFYAISPSDVDINLSYRDISGTKQEFSYMVNDDYGDQSYPNYQNVDVMYAVATNQKKADLTNGVVPLHFKHMLSQVVFKATANSDQMVNVQVKSMKLHNVPSTGTFTFPQSANEAGTWNTVFAHLTDYTVGMDMNEQSDYIEVNHTQEPVDLSVGKPMLFIPAPLTGWDTHHPITNADAQRESYLEIACKIMVGSGLSAHYSVGNANTFGVIYVPFGADWKQGKRYVYTLRFGAGYDENGNEHDIVPITFSVSVDEWVEESKDKDDF